MTKYRIAAVVGCVYVAISAWIVQGAGEAYRKALRLERAANRKTAGAGTPLVKREPATPAEKLPAPGVQARAAAEGASSPRREVMPSGATSEIGSSSLASTSPVTATSKGEPKRQAGAKLQPPDPGYVWADSLDLSTLTPEDERSLGRELHKLVLQYNRPLETGPWEQRLEDAARPLLGARTRKEIDYTFTVLDSEAVNAFSHAGGYVYVCRGLFNLIGEDEDYALEFVVGHEIAHVDLKHALKCLEAANAEEKKRGLGTLPQSYLLISFGYPDQQEFEADAWVCKRMRVDLDRSRHDTLAFLRKFEGYARENGFASGRKLPVEGSERQGEAPPSLVENHFRALTAARRRLNELKVFSDTLKIPPR